MNRYSYYLAACHLESRQPIGEDYFRLQFIDRILSSHPDKPYEGLYVDWYEEIPPDDQEVVMEIVRLAHPAPSEPSLADRLSSAWGRLFNQQQSTTNERPPDDGPPLEGGAGAREPRRPIAPLVSGSAGREYPPTEAAHWWAM